MLSDMRKTAILLAAAVCVLAACSSLDPLVARSAAVPAGLDLSGRWQLEDPAMEKVPSTETLVHVFLETANEVKITQAAEGLFISFDRSVVEEYAYGESREINVGPVIADRVSGWENRGYVIETRDSEGVTLLETYRLGKEGATLQRSISIQKGSRRELDWRQTFSRQ